LLQARLGATPDGGIKFPQSLIFCFCSEPVRAGSAERQDSHDVFRNKVMPADRVGKLPDENSFDVDFCDPAYLAYVRAANSRRPGGRLPKHVKRSMHPIKRTNSSRHSRPSGF
jgi:hypothetical protein